jgi:3-hydroxyacyl-[acyl-carrier-protein] dehydratase
MSDAVTAIPHSLVTQVVLPLTAEAIQAILPHRYPFLLVDRVTHLVPGQQIQGYKLVSHNEPFFQGHFPGKPVMPGVLQLEALAQLGGILISLSPEGEGKMGLFAGIDNARFRRMVVPGDILAMTATVVKLRRAMAKLAVSASVEGQTCVEAELTIGMVERDF